LTAELATQRRIGQSQRSQKLAEGVKHYNTANHLSDAIGKLHAKAILPRSDRSGLSLNKPVKPRLPVLRSVKVIDPASQMLIAPTGDEANSSDRLE
jgi:hypothetical protein